MTKLFETVLATLIILLACLGFIVTMIENPAAWLHMLIHLIGSISMVIVFEVETNRR